MNDLTDKQRARALDLTDEQRARALDLYRKYVQVRNGSPSSVDGRERLSNLSVRAWLAVEAYVLASHTCPDVESDARVRAWLAIAAHPFFADCYSADGTLVDAMVAKLDAAHNHACKPVWRPTTFEEIRAGWEVRARRRNGSEAGWGVAHDQDDDGDWLTEARGLLTHELVGWTYETTAPAPEPKPDPRVGLLEGVCLREGVVLTRSDAALLLSIADAIETPEAGA